MALVTQMPWHNLVYVSCARLCHSIFRLIVIPPRHDISPSMSFGVQALPHLRLLAPPPPPHMFRLELGGPKSASTTGTCHGGCPSPRPSVKLPPGVPDHHQRRVLSCVLSCLSCLLLSDGFHGNSTLCQGSVSVSVQNLSGSLSVLLLIISGTSVVHLRRVPANSDRALSASLSQPPSPSL